MFTFLLISAAYIPVCIAGSTTSILTSEPAVAVSTELDIDYDDEMMTSTPSSSIQRGASFRRVGSALRRRTVLGLQLNA